MKQRILLYSHDSYGLGHLRRNLLLAKAATEREEERSVLVLTGSSVAPKFAWPTGADFIRMPGITKDSSGKYISNCKGLDVHDVLSLRAQIILATVKDFQPDIFVVDKTPLGLLGEAETALHWLRSNRPCRLVLGLRDILDEPSVVAKEMETPNVRTSLTELYDEIWVYGCNRVYDAVATYPSLANVSSKVRFTGYWFDKEQPQQPCIRNAQAEDKQNNVLITTGGGADGLHLLDNFLDMYSGTNGSKYRATMVSGPHLDNGKSQKLASRCADLGIRFHRFHGAMSNLMDQSQCVVCMGGYNTTCEVVGRGLPCVIVPREHPRKEQLLRAEAFDRLGLVSMLPLGDLSPEALEERMMYVNTKNTPPLDTYNLFGAREAVQFRLETLFAELS